MIEPRSVKFTFFSFIKMPLLGLPILGAILKEMGVETKIFCENISSVDWREVANADLVGISVLTPHAPRAYDIVRKIKNMSKKGKESILIVMGGPHPTILPKEALETGADFVIRNEGEIPFKELIEHLNRGWKDYANIKGLSYWKEGEIKHNPPQKFIEDLSEIPFPDFSLINKFKKMSVVPYQTSRGCPYSCEYCSVTEIFGKKIRYCDPEKVIEDLQKLVSTGKRIFIVDDNFSQNRTRVVNLLEMMKKENFKSSWSTQERVSVSEKTEILSLMKETGCERLYLGIESFNAEQLKEWDKRQTPEEAKEAINIIKGFGLEIHGMFIFGGDNDTEDSIRKTIGESIKSGINTTQFFVLTPIPGTKTFYTLEKENRLFDYDWGKYDGMHTVFTPKGLSVESLQYLTLKAYCNFYGVGRGLTWLLKGKLRNAVRFFYARWALKKWKGENKNFLESLKSK